MTGRRLLALVILCTATLMIILDGTIVTVALPAIQASLGFSAGSLSWVLNSYLLAFGGLLLLSGRLGDLLGRKRVFLAGIAVFVLASLGCGFTSTSWVLIAFRFVQGSGAAMASAVTLGMIARLFDEPARQRSAISAFAFTGAVGASAGLILGGLLVEYANWHWIFFVNLPVGVATWVAGLLVLPGDGAHRSGGVLSGRVDVLGALLATGGIMLAVFAIASRPAWWAWPAAAAALTGFFIRQARARTPLLPPRVLASRTVAGANLAQILVIAAAMGFQVTVTLYLQRALGYRPAAAGLGMFPTAAVIALVSLGLAARLMGRFGARALLLAGLVLIAAALALLTRLPAHANYFTWVLPPLVVFGVGGGLTLPAVTVLGLSEATEADAGVVSGLLSTTQQVGAALGVAALSALAAWRSGGATTPEALTSGYRLAFLAGAGLAAASAVVAAVALRSRSSVAGPPRLADLGEGPDDLLAEQGDEPGRVRHGR